MNPLIPILERAWKQGIAIQSQFFRNNSHLVAMAASQSLITTSLPSGQYCGVWRITPEGCYDLFYNEAQEQHNELNLTHVETGELPEPLHPNSAAIDNSIPFSLISKGVF